jgi:hypothetical protein
MNYAEMGGSGNYSVDNYSLNWIKESRFEIFTTVKYHIGVYCIMTECTVVWQPFARLHGILTHGAVSSYWKELDCPVRLNHTVILEVESAHEYYYADELSGSDRDNRLL